MRGSDILVQQVYDELKTEASKMLGKRTTEPLHPTELVHEVWARLEKHSFDNQRHYKAVAAVAMVQILTDHARARNSHKRKGEHVTLSAAGAQSMNIDLLALHRALGQLKTQDARAYEVVTLRYLGGMSVDEVSEWMGLSPRTIQTVWRLARLWLMERLQG